MSGRETPLHAYAPLIGTWTTEATHPEFDGVVPGETTFEWLEGRRFIVQRSRNEHELFPDSIEIVGPSESGDGLVVEYFDSRGVRRTYGTTLEDHVLRMWRDDDPTFRQRFAATLGDERFEGLWQVADEHGAWVDDLRVRYVRRA